MGVQEFSGPENPNHGHESAPALSGESGVLFPHVYTQLRDLAHRKMAQESRGLTLQTTALVHEVYLRLSSDPDVRWENPRHFYAAAAEAMRRILIERARRYATTKRGEGRRRESLEQVDEAGAAVAETTDPAALLSLDEALTELRTFDPDLAEVVMLRFFAGLTFEEVAATLGRSLRAVKYDWSVARAWLLRRIEPRGA